MTMQTWMGGAGLKARGRHWKALADDADDLNTPT
jgi:hypothetical protein